MKIITAIIAVILLSASIVNVYAISKPDLVAKSFEASLLKGIGSGSSMLCILNITATVKNEGNLTSTLTPIIIRDLTTGSVIYDTNVGQLDPSTEKNITDVVSIQGAGIHKLIFEVNPAVDPNTDFRLVDEFNTNNNSIEKDVICQSFILVPDLTITDLAISVISEPEGDKLQIDYSVKNIGNLTSDGGYVGIRIKTSDGDYVTIHYKKIGREIIPTTLIPLTLEPLQPNEEKVFTAVLDITGDIHGNFGIPLQIGNNYEVFAIIYNVASEINTSNNVMKKEFTYTTSPRAGLFITPLGLGHLGNPISIQLCAEEPLNVLSSVIISPSGKTYYNLEQFSLNVDECYVLYGQDFKDHSNTYFRPSIVEEGGLYTIIIDTDKGPIYGEFIKSFFVLPESFIGVVGIIGVAISVFTIYGWKKRGIN